MLAFAKKLRDEVGGGVLTSLALHLLVAALLFLQLPQWKTTPPEPESVEVKVVPPPEPQPKPEPEKKEEKAEAPQPQPAPAPAAAAASSRATFPILPRSEKESTEEKKPASGEGTTQNEASTPQSSDAETAKTDAGQSASPIEAKPVTPDIAESQSSSKPSETAGQAELQSPAPTMSLENAAVSQQKSQPVPKKIEQQSKPDGSKAMKSSNPFANLSQKFLPNPRLDPRMGRVVTHLSPQGRLKSLCTAEAIGQLGLGQNDALVLTGPSSGFVSNTSYKGVGVFFRRNGNWYNWDFQCSADSNVTRVSSFQFKIGNAIPSSEVRKRGLPMD
ncbi:uncharacterized protein DUF930 [Phyllobacterium myrsinacearum]|uniref:DUF930 domain-containing protein n=1 Tax=Phyllobacterium myrsinacearum TaxID=28101 RepID=UPI001029DB13|nr:DUF930 domain-containing protein [Phyllobacterium myrsinacearum]RZS87831.1 uncharacterized protein DUF930 [Phyllobacterium myrsinacearum]